MERQDEPVSDEKQEWTDWFQYHLSNYHRAKEVGSADGANNSFTEAAKCASILLALDLLERDAPPC